jgi:branched-chain amino acid transport system substrate-binding protein
MKTKLGMFLTAAVLVCLAFPLMVFAGGEKEDVILVGSPLPLTGPYASDGEQMKMALELAIAEYNENGGLLGKQLKLMTGDVGALEPEKIKAVGERLAGSGVHVAITGYADSGVDARVFGQYDMPFIHADAMTAAAEVARKHIEEDGTSNVFQYCPAEVAYGDDAAEYLFEATEEMGWEAPNKNVAIVKVDYSYNILAADRFKELVEQKGYNVVVDEIIQFGHVEFGPILSKIENSNASYVTFWDLDPKDAANFIKQFHDEFSESGIDAVVYMQYTPAIPEFLELSGEAAEGVLWATTVKPVSDDVPEYEQRWIDHFDDSPKSSYSYGTRDGFEVWAEAVKRAGAYDDYDKIIEELRDAEYAGLTGRIVFDPEDQTAYAGEEYIPTVWHQIWDGKNNVIKPKDYVEGYSIKLPPWIK